MDDNKSLYDFIKDVIALANSARRIGKDAYILFGVDDDRNITGIEGQDVRINPRPEACAPSGARVKDHQGDYIGRMMLDKIVRHIGEFGASYEYGYVDDHLVSYLHLPGYTPEAWKQKPYEVKESVKEHGNRKKNLLEKGACFVRVGESNRSVAEDEKANLTCHSVVPYVSLEQWEQYAQILRDVMTQTQPKDFASLDYKIDNQLNEQSLQTIVDEYIHRGRTHFLLHGVPGSGKTEAIKRVVAKLAENLLIECRNLVKDGQLYNIPVSYIPLYLSFEDLGISGKSLINLLISEIRKWKRECGINHLTDSRFENLLINSKFKFMLFLDALDSVRKDVNKIQKIIRDFEQSTENRFVMVFVCRSSFVDKLFHIREMTRIEVQCLSYVSIRDYLGFRTKLAEEFIKLVHKDEVFGEFINKPMFIKHIRAQLVDLEEELAADLQKLILEKQEELSQLEALEKERQEQQDREQDNYEQPGAGEEESPWTSLSSEEETLDNEEYEPLTSEEYEALTGEGYDAFMKEKLDLPDMEQGDQSLRANEPNSHPQSILVSRIPTVDFEPIAVEQVDIKNFTDAFVQKNLSIYLFLDQVIEAFLQLELQKNPLGNHIDVKSDFSTFHKELGKIAKAMLYATIPTNRVNRKLLQWLLDTNIFRSINNNREVIFTSEIWHDYAVYKSIIDDYPNISNRAINMLWKMKDRQ